MQLASVSKLLTCSEHELDESTTAPNLMTGYFYRSYLDWFQL